MRFKGTLVLLLVFVALGGYVYFAEYRGQEERQKQEDAKKKVFGVEEKDIAEITLEYPDRTITAVKKGEKQWEITNPAGLEADPDEWDSLASNLIRVEKGEIVTGEKADLAPYGLDKPTVKVSAKLQDGRTIGILFGSENPRKTFNYAKMADKDEVFLSATSWSGLFKKSLTDLRNKKVLDLQAENVDSVKITVAGGLEIELQKSEMDWLLKKPVEARADSAEVNSFLSSIQFARASDFADSTVDPKTAGLEPPAVKVAIHDQKSGMDRVLVFGKTTTKDVTDKFFAKDQSRPPVFILGKEILEKARRPAADWRDKSVAQFNREGIDELEISRGADKLSLKKAGSDWQVADGRKLQLDKVPTMLNTLEGERALQIVDSPKSLISYGLDKPRLEVRLRQGGKDVLGLKFGRDTSSPQGVHIQNTSNGAVMIVPKDLYSRFDVNLSDLIEVQPGTSPPAK